MTAAIRRLQPRHWLAIMVILIASGLVVIDPYSAWGTW